MTTTPSSEDRPQPQPVPRWLMIGGPTVILVVVALLGLMLLDGGDDEPERPTPVAAEEDAPTVDASRLNDLEMLLASLEARIAGQEDDLSTIRSQHRRLDDSLAELESATSNLGPDQGLADRVDSMHDELTDLRTELNSLDVAAPIKELEGALRTTQQRVARLEETPETPKPNAALTGVEHWGSRHFAILEGAGGRERVRVGGRYGQWTLESLDANAGVAVLRHPRGYMHALAVDGD